MSANSESIDIKQTEVLERRSFLHFLLDLLLEVVSDELWDPCLTPLTSIGSSAIPRDESDDQHHEQCDQLLPVYHGVVAILTELLNTEHVHLNGQNRTHIQEQLMEAQLKCRQQRRRHSLDAKRNLALAISDHLKFDERTKLL
ncbi:hypothetical protein C7974DRAFT_350022 [Boeremia exigua]|uniref:uncharacterized protein n=1 Tax=Boeremia exigua TaxID=749465 RepID=UPI001E8DF20D|nr:uncharacterized protein C7974DRAFT_350022 [Boeremia exigua]KAH6644900.1 hypothetical protein C7974DRAFT_350022 [Boeremia exigua]